LLYFGFLYKEFIEYGFNIEAAEKRKKRKTQASNICLKTFHIFIKCKIYSQQTVKHKKKIQVRAK